MYCDTKVSYQPLLWVPAESFSKYCVFNIVYCKPSKGLNSEANCYLLDTDIGDSLLIRVKN